MDILLGMGLCEAFNGTFKRDYVYENCLDNPLIGHDKIQSWVDEYNKYTLHSALNIKTPNEYYNFKLAALPVQFLSGKHTLISIFYPLHRLGQIIGMMLHMLNNKTVSVV